MKVIDKQLLFISSDERDSGSISDFTVAMPSHLLTCRPSACLHPVLIIDLSMHIKRFQTIHDGRHGGLALDERAS